MSKSALIVYGGWDGHKPKEIAEFFDRILSADGFKVTVSDSLSAFDIFAQVAAYDLIVPHWTMGKISGEQCANVCKAVENGTGLAGCHGGMCDAFRENTEWQFMTGGQFVAHPGNDGTEYPVHVDSNISHITRGISDFIVKSEQYYMHFDPAVVVLASTPFPVAPGPHTPNGKLRMPVVWTKLYGKGRVFYNALGHSPALLETEPCLTLMRRGFEWAAR